MIGCKTIQIGKKRGQELFDWRGLDTTWYGVVSVDILRYEVLILSPRVQVDVCFFPRPVLPGKLPPPQKWFNGGFKRGLFTYTISEVTSNHRIVPGRNCQTETK